MNYYSLEPNQPDTREPSRRMQLLRGLLFGSVSFLILLLLLLSVLLILYSRVAADLPLPEELAQRAGAFQSTRIYDRNGVLLNETFDPNAGRRVVVPLADMSPWVRQATIATEDANFYEHPGVDPVALARALYYAVQEREFVSGASTIPQQLVKLLFLSAERSVQRKVQEAILAAEVTRRYEKDRILEFYLNEVYYGNLAYGVDAAAETYFGKEVGELTLSEASLLAGLPQAPAFYDPYAYPERAKDRQAVVLRLMVENGDIGEEEANAAWLEPLIYTALHYDLEAPHFTLFVRQQLEQLLGPEALYKVGLEVTTSLDRSLQDEAQQIVTQHVASLAERNVSNGALVALNPDTGEILALVGSAGFDNVEIDGQVNMALSPRQPGSAIKPLVYLTALEEQGWTPGTLIADIEEDFPDGANPPYRPTNYDEQEHGLVTVRTALANSYNIPAVRALQTVGLPSFLDQAQQLGISSLNRDDYGLSLSLGGGEVTLLELTSAFSVLANEGVRVPPQPILRIEDGAGNVICDIESETPCRLGPSAAGEQVIDPVDAFLITDILSDNDARIPVFGPSSQLNLGRPAAAKTGTTNDFRDALTVGFTPHIVAGVWVGNADNSPMQNVSGAGGAAPIWNRFMNLALAERPADPFPVPPGVEQVEICADTGTRPSEACPQRAVYWFDPSQPPLSAEEDLWRRVRIDSLSGERATEFTPPDLVEEQIFKVYPDPYREWAIAHGIPQPPEGESTIFTFEPRVEITQPGEGENVVGTVNVVGVADVPGFASYEIQYGVSHEPGAFSPPIWGPIFEPNPGGILGQWRTEQLLPGPHTLRLLVRDTFGNQYESRIQLWVTASPPTATPEPESTPLPTIAPEPTSTATPVPEASPPPDSVVEPTPGPAPVEPPLDPITPPAAGQ